MVVSKNKFDIVVTYFAIRDVSARCLRRSDCQEHESSVGIDISRRWYSLNLNDFKLSHLSQSIPTSQCQTYSKKNWK